MRRVLRRFAAAVRLEQPPKLPCSCLTSGLRMDYTDLERLIAEIEKAVDDSNPQKGYWKHLWGVIHEARSGFRDARFPTGEEKHHARTKLDNLVEAAQARSEQEKLAREDRERNWEETKRRSEAARQRLDSKLAGTRPTTDFERMIASVILMPLTILENALRGILGLEQLDEIHEDLKGCSANMREAWATFSATKQEMLPGDRNIAYQELRKAQDRLDEAWQRWRGAKNQAHEERRRAWEERNREREAKRRDFVGRVETNIGKLEEKIAKAEDALERQERHLANLREQYDSAWSDSFKDRCSGWIDEAEERIRDIENSIDRMKGWLDEERAKLDR